MSGHGTIGSTEREATTIELTPTAIAIAIALVAFTVVPLYLLAGTPEAYYFGVPRWGWILFAVHWIILGLIVAFVREINLIAATREVVD